MTMAIQNTPLSDLIAMDSTFASRCQLRKSLVQNHRHEILAANPRGVPAVLELYRWLTRVYLPRRFPSIYTLLEDGKGLMNEVTGTVMPMDFEENVNGAETALQILGENVDDEFLIMLPSQNPADDGKYRLEAFVNCFPSGFNTRSKLGLLLSEIHNPVPGYKEK